MKKFTVSEVRELAKHMESVGWRLDSNGDRDCCDEGAARSAEMLFAFADMLEAQEKAVPVVTRESAINALAHVGQYNGPGRETEARQMLVEGSPSATHPAPSDAERLEELGRILRGAMIQGDARVIGKNELKHALEILAAHSAQAQPPYELDPAITEKWENGELGRSLEYAQVAQPPAASVTDAMVDAALTRAVIASKESGIKGPTRYMMRAALESALAAQENPNG